MDSLPFTRRMVLRFLRCRTVRRKLYVRAYENPNTPKNLARRLANGLDAAPKNSCWIWKRTSDQHGYGRIRIKGETLLAPRIAYSLSIGPIPRGLWVLHTCDTPACINPHHLFLGTQVDNMRDAASKGRLWTQKLKGKIHHCVGEANGNAKLTNLDVYVIRRAIKKGVKQIDLAMRFGVSRSIICNIKKGKIWKHLLVETATQ